MAGQELEMRLGRAFASIGVVKGVLALVAAATLLLAKPATMAGIALGSLMVFLCTRGFLHIQAERHKFLLERQRLMLEGERIKAEWRHRQQDSYEFQLSLDTDTELRIGRPRRRSTDHLLAKKKRTNQAGLQLLTVNGRASAGSERSRSDPVEMR